MATPLSIHNLLDGGWRTILSIAGISVAVVLIFMQLGFLGAVLDTAVVFYDNLKFDLVARSPDYYHFCDANKFSREYLDQIKNVEGVRAIQPYHVSLGKWNYAEKSVQRGMLIMGVDPNGQTFEPSQPDIQAPDVSLLNNENFILVDQKSRPKFLGADNDQGFTENELGLRIELNRHNCELAGLFRLGTGLAADGAAVIHERGFERLFPNYKPDDVTLGLIQLDATAQKDPESVRDKINQLMKNDPDLRPSPVEILTRREIVRREIAHWVGNTPVGFIFIAGVAVALVVGSIVVYIVLSSDITKQISEYATLKAMGYANRYLFRVVLEQALILGLISYVSAFGISLVLYQLVGSAANLPITMTFSRQVIVFISTLVMCCLSGVVAMQKLRKADPADLF